MVYRYRIVPFEYSSKGMIAATAGGEEINNVFQISRAAAWASPFVVQGVEAVAGFRIENDEVFLTAVHAR